MSTDWKVINTADIYTKAMLPRQNRQLNLQIQMFYWELSAQLWSAPRNVHGFPNDFKFVCS